MLFFLALLEYGFYFSSFFIIQWQNTDALYRRMRCTRIFNVNVLQIYTPLPLLKAMSSEFFPKARVAIICSECYPNANSLVSVLVKLIIATFRISLQHLGTLKCRILRCKWIIDLIIARSSTSGWFGTFAYLYRPLTLTPTNSAVWQYCITRKKRVYNVYTKTVFFSNNIL